MFQSTGILANFEELKRERNTGFGPKDIFEITFNSMDDPYRQEIFGFNAQFPVAVLLKKRGSYS